jgi:hypothetical protein
MTNHDCIVSHRRPARWLLPLLAFAASGCTIDAIARAELAGDPGGRAIFQQAGTRDQVSVELDLEGGVDGAYAVHIDDGRCSGASRRWVDLGVIEVVRGSGVLRYVTSRWSVEDAIGRVLVVERASAASGCGTVVKAD